MQNIFFNLFKAMKVFSPCYYIYKILNSSDFDETKKFKVHFFYLLIYIYICSRIISKRSEVLLQAHNTQVSKN